MSSSAPWLTTSTQTVPWIDEDPDSFDFVQITPGGQPLTFTFLCEVSGVHETKVDQWQALNTKGHNTTTRGRKGAQLEIKLLIQDATDWDALQVMMPLLMANSAGQLLAPSLVQCAQFQAMGFSQQLHYTKGHVPARHTGGVMQVQLSFLEDLPPGPNDQTDNGAIASSSTVNTAAPSIMADPPDPGAVVLPGGDPATDGTTALPA